MKLVNAPSMVAAVCVAISASAQQTPRAALDRARKAYAATQTVSVSFEQTLVNPLTGRKLESHGTLVHRKPNLLSVTFSDPAADRIVSDGESLWVYLPSSAPGQVVKMSASAQEGMLVDPLGQILSASGAGYSVTDGGATMVGGRPTHAVIVVPTSGHAAFTRATIWIGDVDGIVRQIDATEPSGLERKVTMTSYRTNAIVPRSTFTFTPPAGIRIVDAAGGIAG